MARNARKTKKHVVTYVRMSTTKQDASPARQRRELNKYCEDHGYIVDHEYCDLGVSGDNTKKRVQFLEMMRLAAAGQIKHILAFDTARLSRADALEAGKHFAPVRDAGCIVETVSDGVLDYDEFGSRLSLIVKQEMDHEKIVTLSRDVVSGQTAVAEAGIGYPGMATPIGYKREVIRTKSTSRDRNKWSAQLVIDEDTAPIVRRIFKEYNKIGGSIRSVCAKLNAEGIPAPRGGIWRQMTLQVVLRNRLYRGDYVWGKKQTGKYHTRAGESGGVKKRKKSDKKVKTDPIVHEGIMPRIIDEDTWQTAQRLLEERKRDYTPPKTCKPLSGLIYCSECGGKMRADADGYRCTSAGSDEKNRCPSYRLPGDALMEGVVGELSKILCTQPGKGRLRQQLRKSIEKKNSSDGDIKQLRKQLKSLDSEIKTGTARLTRLSDKLANRLMEHLETLETQRESVATELAKLEGTASRTGDSYAAVDKVINNLVKYLALMPEGGGDPMLVNQLLKASGVTVEVRPVSARTRKGDRHGHISVNVPPVQYSQPNTYTLHTLKSRSISAPNYRRAFSW